MVKQQAHNSAGAKVALRDLIAATEGDAIVLWRPINRIWGNRAVDMRGYQVFIVLHDSAGGMQMRNISATVALATGLPYDGEGDDNAEHLFTANSAFDVWETVIHRARPVLVKDLDGDPQEFTGHLRDMFREFAWF